MRAAIALGCLGLFAACAPDLRTDFPFDGETSDGGTHVVFEDQGGGVTKLTVDATNKTGWVYVDLDAVPEPTAELKAQDAFDTQAWDLAFQRFKIVSNGGGGGPGAVQVAVLTGATEGSFEALVQAPATGFAQDLAEPILNTNEGGWYYYDLGVHKLVTRADLLYVVHTTGDAYFKLQMLDYYDENGTAARPSLRVGRIAAP